MMQDDTLSFPGPGILAAYAAGTLPAGLSLLVACQLTWSPEGRRRVESLEALGGALLDAERPEPPAPDALDRILARMEREGRDDPDPAATALPPPAPDDPFPAPLRQALGGGPERVRWSFRLPGLSECELPELGEPDEEVSLLRARPGAPIPSHTHTGVETTLVLCGALRDGDRVYGPGEAMLATDAIDHKPKVEGRETCICLVVMTGSMRFTGFFTRHLNRLM